MSVCNSGAGRIEIVQITVPFAIRSLTANSFWLAKNILWLLLVLGIFITHFALQEVNKVLTFTC
jgi:hypothetical protein